VKNKREYAGARDRSRISMPYALLSLGRLSRLPDTINMTAVSGGNDVSRTKGDNLLAKADQHLTSDETMSLVRRFQDGDKAAENELVQRMKNDEQLAEVLSEAASTMRTKWFEYMNSNEFTREVLATRALALKRSLLGDDPTVLESLLAEQIVTRNIAMEMAEAEYMSVMRAGSSFKKAEFYERTMDRASRRYVSAIKALAQVRRLQLPAVAQVNVATNQLNVVQAADGNAGDPWSD
jgi:hypothetical protein